jgi:hypothetical protein
VLGNNRSKMRADGVVEQRWLRPSRQRRDAFQLSLRTSVGPFINALVSKPLCQLLISHPTPIRRRHGPRDNAPELPLKHCAPALRSVIVKASSTEEMGEQAAQLFMQENGSHRDGQTDEGYRPKSSDREATCGEKLRGWCGNDPEVRDPEEPEA